MEQIGWRRVDAPFQVGGGMVWYHHTSATLPYVHSGDTRISLHHEMRICKTCDNSLPTSHTRPLQSRLGESDERRNSHKKGMTMSLLSSTMLRRMASLSGRRVRTNLLQSRAMGVYKYDDLERLQKKENILEVRDTVESGGPHGARTFFLCWFHTCSDDSLVATSSPKNHLILFPACATA